MNRMTNIGDLLPFSQSTDIVLFFFVLCSSSSFLTIRQRASEESAIGPCSLFPSPHPLGLVVNKSPVVFIFMRALDDPVRENSGSVNRLVASLLIQKMRTQDSAIHLSNNWGLANKSLSTG